MNSKEWLAYAQINRDALESIIARYHPVNRRLSDLPITAPNAERACEEVRQDIKRNTEGNPLTKFRDALASNDWKSINLVLNEVWFGVPESTLAWQIEGFREMINLIEEPPDDLS
jgi:hypothetical protein